MDYRDVTFVAVVLTACWLAAACSSTGGGGPAVDADFRDHLPAAVEHARQAVAQVEGTLPSVVHPALTEVPGAPCSGYYCAAHPEGYLARGWCDVGARHVYIAGPSEFVCGVVD